MIFENQRPGIYVIAGPNGAGKTTFASRFLPAYVHCTEFLNADLIAAGLSPFAPESQNTRASELMLERMDGLLERRETFSFETTLAARTYRQKIIGWRSIGYYVHLFFLWLPSADMAVARVANRVIQGGHGLPEETIRTRYARGIANFHNLYRPVVDQWSCFDSSRLPPTLIAQSEGSAAEIFNQATWQIIEQKEGNST